MFYAETQKAEKISVGDKQVETRFSKCLSIACRHHNQTTPPETPSIFRIITAQIHRGRRHVRRLQERTKIVAWRLLIWINFKNIQDSLSFSRTYQFSCHVYICLLSFLMFCFPHHIECICTYARHFRIMEIWRSIYNRSRELRWAQGMTSRLFQHPKPSRLGGCLLFNPSF